MSDMQREGSPPARLSSVDAAFKGFDLIRREPSAFVVWMLATALFSGAIGVAQAVLFGPAMARFQVMQEQAKAAGSTLEPSAILAMAADAWRFNGLALLFSLVFYAVMNAAVYRAVLKPQAGGPGFLRLGGDELRQAGLFIMIFFVAIAAEIALIVIAVIIAVVVGVAAAASGGAHLSPEGARWVVPGVILGMILLAFAALAVVVRFSLAGPATFDQKKVQLFSSWRLTRGRFWVLFGAYLLAAFVFAVLAIVCLLITGVVALMIGSGLGGIESLVRPKAQTVVEFFTPVRIVFLLLNAPLGAAWLATQAGIPATVYAAIRAEQDRRRPADLSHSFGAPMAPPPEGDLPIVPPGR